MTQKTQQQLFEQLQKERNVYDKDGHMIEGKLNPIYQEALDKLDFSKKYRYQPMREVTEKYPLSVILDNNDYEGKLQDVVATGRVSIEDIANACNESAERVSYSSNIKETLKEILTYPNIKKQIESHPKAWADITKFILGYGGGYAMGGTIKDAYEYMMHSPEVKTEEMRKALKETLKSVKRVWLHSGFSNQALYDNINFYTKMEPDELELLAELCPNIEELDFPQESSRGPFSIGSNTSDKHAAILPKFKKLKKFSYEGHGLTDKSLEYLGQIKGLEKIFIKGTHFSDEAVEHLKGLKHLKELSIRVSDEKLQEVCPYLILSYADETGSFPPEYIGPGHKDYQEKKSRLDAERQYVIERTTEGWKDIFYKELKAGHKYEALQILKLNNLLSIAQPQDSSCFSIDKSKPIDPALLDPAGFRYGYLRTKDTFTDYDILDLGNNNVAVGLGYDDAKWKGRGAFLAWGGGCAYARSVEVDIVNLDKGITNSSGRTEPFPWRDPHDGSKDIPITNKRNFLTIEKGTVVASLESYGKRLASTSVPLPGKGPSVMEKLQEAMIKGAKKEKVSRALLKKDGKGSM